ncbi:hypothetical protein AnigIFM63326_008206 [Aspergillus niger]|nr:hypothetical protein AnigIFM63326_008206 [Aspergillus niger]
MPDDNGKRNPNICKDVGVIAKLHICTAKGAEIPKRDAHLLRDIVRDELPFDLHSEMCLSLAASWLDKCCRKHAKCEGYKDGAHSLPTRVIDVGDSFTQPYLHISADGETRKWAALSYCWGGDSNFTLNASSFDDLRSGRSLATFPATLRDAVLVTRALEFRYLWVDSLCIFQDDSNDWAVESSRMSRIYRHAAVTIAATSAETADDGFLDKRAPYFSCPFPWRRRSHRGSVNDDFRAYPVVFRSYTNEINKESLRYSRWATRGWTFQEELLSKRLLYYTKEEMIWKCRAVTFREPGEEPATSLIEHPRPLPVPLPKQDELYAANDVPDPYRNWYLLLEKYLLRDLSFDGDRLPAIEALAEFFHAQFGEQYCAGLWRGDLLFGLLWSIHRNKYYPGPLADTARRSEVQNLSYQYKHNKERYAPVGDSSKQRKPSWSWVGADTYVGLKWPQLRWMREYTYLTKIRDFKVHGQLHGVFGHVEGAELTLEAPYRHLHLKLDSYSKSRWNPVRVAQRVLTRFSPLASMRELAQVALVRPGYLAGTETSGSVIVPSSSMDFTLIHIAEVTRFDPPVLYLLILQPQPRNATNSRGPHHYRRVGLLRLSPHRYNSSDSVRVAETKRLESDAYTEATTEKWPVGTFVID